MRINALPRIKRLFRLRTILLIVMLSVLLLPLGSLYFFRFYENELVRKTEIELISQSAVFSALYRAVIGKDALSPEGSYSPIPPQLDLSSQSILPRRPTAILPAISADPSLDHQTSSQLHNILRNTQTITLAGIRILDTKGIVVVGRNEVGLSLAHIHEVKQALAGHYTSVLRERISDEPQPSVASLSRGTGIRVFTAFPIMDQGENYGVIYLSRTPQNILKHLYSIKEQVLLLTLLLLSLTGLLVSFISSRLSRPIRELIQQTQKVTQGEIETIEAIQKPGSYEVAELSNSFAEMSHTLHDRTQYIKQFASHVSHEFKTPLTSMQASLELLQEHINDMPLTQQKQFIHNLQGDTERLKNLVNRLLEQAHADTLQSSPASSDLQQVVNTLVSQYTDKNIRFIFDDAAMVYTLNISIAALESVLSNLFDNSMHHGATEITLSAIQGKQQLQLSIHDNGSGISPANKTHIFTPFFTTRRDQGGTGLGLGIVAATLTAWHGSITLQDTDIGAHFILIFNCADCE